MRRRFALLLLAATAFAAAFIIPASASARNTHTAFRSSVRALHAPKAAGLRPAGVNIAWTPAATLPTAVEETGGGAAIGNSFYVIGGYTSFSPATVTNANQLYNKSTNSWSSKSPIPGTGGGWADAAFCVNPSDRTVHVVNGVDGSFLYAAHQVYNTLTDTWTFAAAPNTVADGNFYSQDSGCTFIGGKLYLWSGYGLTDANPAAAIQTLTWVYDPATDTWANTGKNLITGRLWMGYTGSSTNGYAAGGTNNITTFAPVNTAEKFTPATGWAAQPVLPQALLAPGMGFIKGHEMVWGGGNSSFVPQNKTYHCLNGTCGSWQTTAFNLPSAKWFSAFATGGALYNGGGDTGSGVPVNTSEHLP
jgi:hypothetical protein